MPGCCWSRWLHRGAAVRIDEAGIDRLRAVLRAEEDRQPDPAAPNDEFHAALAEQSKNPVLQLFIDILMRLTVRYAEGSRLDSASEAFEAIEAPPPRSLSHCCRRHRRGRGARDDTERTTRGVGDEVAAGPPSRWGPRGAYLANREAPQGKLAEVLAAAIRDDIASSGWQVGEVFGTEVALLERYQVSRAVLREAVRLLEYHAVAITRRGPGGGLVVAEPQAQASIDTIALYLQYREPCREDLTMIRDAIEIDNVAKVVARHETPEVRAFLDSQRLMIEQAGDDPRKAGVEEFLFHAGLAKLAGNAVLDLFLRILVEVFRRYWASTDQPVPSHADLVDVRHAHLRIIEAIARGDDSLARHRIRRHLDAAASWWL